MDDLHLIILILLLSLNIVCGLIVLQCIAKRCPPPDRRSVGSNPPAPGNRPPAPPAPPPLRCRCCCSRHHRPENQPGPE